MNLTKRALYDLVWSKSMTKVSAELGISDIGLAEICNRHRIPTPPRGYWAKLEAGKKVKKATFVKIGDPALDHISIQGGLSELPEPIREIVVRQKAERRPIERHMSQVSQTLSLETKELSALHSAIRSTARRLRSNSARDSNVARAVDEGMRGIIVGLGSIERTINILDLLAHGLSSRGLAFVPTGKAIKVATNSDSELFHIEETTKQVPRIVARRL